MSCARLHGLSALRAGWLPSDSSLPAVVELFEGCRFCGRARRRTSGWRRSPRCRCSEDLVSEDLFDGVQELRKLRARTLRPRRPSNRYLLRGLARCERCQGKMHGTAVGRKLSPSYYCSTRRASKSCDQATIAAGQVEGQLADFVADFRPDAAIREEILRRLARGGASENAEVKKQRGALEERLRRIRDLYELGDLSRPEYLGRRDAIHAELAELAPPPLPDLSAVERVLSDLSLFWRHEDDAEAKRQLLRLIFETVWLDAGRVVAVRPTGRISALLPAARKQNRCKSDV